MCKRPQGHTVIFTALIIGTVELCNYLWATHKLLKRFCHTCEAIVSELAMVSPLTSHFKSDSIDEHCATAFQPRSLGRRP